MKEYSSSLHTIDNPHELERLLLSADNLTWNYPKGYESLRYMQKHLGCLEMKNMQSN